MPLFARAGAIVPRQDYAPHVSRSAPDPLILNVYRGRRRAFTLYEDQGVGFGYQAGQFARTSLRWDESGTAANLTIGAAKGSYKGQPSGRGYSVRVLGVDRPSSVAVAAGGRTTAVTGYDYDASARLLTVDTPRLATKRAAVVRLSFGEPPTPGGRGPRG